MYLFNVNYFVLKVVLFVSHYFFLHVDEYILRMEISDCLVNLG